MVDFNNAKIPVGITSRYSHNLIVTQVLRFMCIVVIQCSDANAKKHRTLPGSRRLNFVRSMAAGFPVFEQDNWWLMGIVLR